MVRIKYKIKNMLKSYFQAIYEELDLFKINFTIFIKNFTSQLSITSAGSISFAHKEVFANYKNSNNDNNGENLFI